MQLHILEILQPDDYTELAPNIDNVGPYNVNHNSPNKLSN